MLSRGEREALGWGLFYRQKRFNPVPSSMEDKKPLYAFVEDYGWEQTFPGRWFTESEWEKRPTTNLQVVCGSAWRLLVVDLDGAEAKKVWDRWAAERGCPQTWTVHRDGGDSRHLWFKSPRWWDGPIKKRAVWKEAGADHSAIEILGDRSLVVAPPSRHVKTGGQYRFVNRRCSPCGMGHPAEAPAWIMNLPAIAPERPKVEFVAKRPSKPLPVLDRDSLPDRNRILDMVHDKAAFARTHWGVRLTGNVSPTGWAECHSPFRQDDNPSAAIHRDTGVYTDRGTSECMSFLDFYAAMTGLPSWKEAMQDIWARHR